MISHSFPKALFYVSPSLLPDSCIRKHGPSFSAAFFGPSAFVRPPFPRPSSLWNTLPLSFPAPRTPCDIILSFSRFPKLRRGGQTPSLITPPFPEMRSAQQAGEYHATFCSVMILPPFVVGLDISTRQRFLDASPLLAGSALQTCFPSSRSWCTATIIVGFSSCRCSRAMGLGASSPFSHSCRDGGCFALTTSSL